MNVRIAPTPKDIVLREGTASTYRFRRPEHRPAADCLPILVVPSLINRWYVLDLREGASLISALNETTDVFCIDWGVPEDEDRYLSWDAIVGRLGRAVRLVRRLTGADRVGLLGYCMGGTLAAIHSALEPGHVAGLVNLAGPIDFEEGGMLRAMTDPRWFDPEAVAEAGNVAPFQMQSGFFALNPTMAFSKWVSLWFSAGDSGARDAFLALEAWANDNTPFPGAAYATYVRELYQENLLVRGEHHVLGRRVDLKAIRCPVLTIVATKDTICPPAAAMALHDSVSSSDKEVLEIRGGHVGAVVGPGARTALYPRLSEWVREKLGPSGAAPLGAVSPEAVEGKAALQGR